MNFFKMLSIFSLLSSWMKKSLEDGKITLREALELLELLATELDLPLDFKVGVVLGNAGPKKEAVIDEGEGVVEDEVHRHPHRPL